MYLDFRTPTDTPIEHAAKMLNLILHPDGNRLIGPCPACGASDLGCLVIRPRTNSFICYESSVGGDTVGLVQHQTGLSAEEAIAYLQATAPRQ